MFREILENLASAQRIREAGAYPHRTA